MTLKRVDGVWYLVENGQAVCKGTHADIISILINLWGAK